jgi:hypothetical protein
LNPFQTRYICTDRKAKHLLFESFMVPFNLTEINTTMERYAFCEYIRTRSFSKRPDKKMHLKKLGLCTCMGIARCLIMGLDSHHSLKFYYCAIFCTGTVHDIRNQQHILITQLQEKTREVNHLQKQLLTSSPSPVRMSR